MLEVGDMIEIGGKPATVCYKTIQNEENYICVAFETDKLQYDIYKYKYEEGKLLVAKVEDEKELVDITKIFLEEGVDQYGFPEELKPIIEYVEKHIDKLKPSE